MKKTVKNFKIVIDIAIIHNKFQIKKYIYVLMFDTIFLNIIIPHGDETKQKH